MCIMSSSGSGEVPRVEKLADGTNASLLKASEVVILEWAHKKFGTPKSSYLELAEFLVASGHVTGLAADAFNQLAANRKGLFAGQKGTVLSESNDVKKREINAQLKLKICEHEQKKALQGKSCSQSLNVPDMMKKSPGMMKQTAIKDQKSKISTTGNVLQQTLSKPLTPQKLILPKTDNNLKASPHKNAIVASPVPTAAASLFLMNSQALPSPVLLLSPLTGNTVDGVVPSLQSSAVANTFSINTALKKPLGSNGGISMDGANVKQQTVSTINVPIRTSLGHVFNGQNSNTKHQLYSVKTDDNHSIDSMCKKPVRGNISNENNGPNAKMQGKPRVADLLRECRGTVPNTTVNDPRKVSTLLKEKRDIGKRSLSATPMLNHTKVVDNGVPCKVSDAVEMMKVNGCSEGVETVASSSGSILVNLLSPVEKAPPKTVLSEQLVKNQLSTFVKTIDMQDINKYPSLKSINKNGSAVVTYILNKNLSDLTESDVIHKIGQSCPTSAECRLLLGDRVDKNMPSDSPNQLNTEFVPKVETGKECNGGSKMLNSSLPVMRTVFCSTEHNSLLRDLLSQKPQSNSTPVSANISKLSPKGANSVISPPKSKPPLNNGNPSISLQSTTHSNLSVPSSPSIGFVPIQFLEKQILGSAVKPKVALVQLDSKQLLDSGKIVCLSDVVNAAATSSLTSSESSPTLEFNASQTQIPFVPSSDGKFVPYDSSNYQQLSGAITVKSEFKSGGSKRGKLLLNIDSEPQSKKLRQSYVSEANVMMDQFSDPPFWQNENRTIETTSSAPTDAKSFLANDNSDSLESPFSPEMESIMSRSNRMDQWVELQHQANIPTFFRSHSVPSTNGSAAGCNASTRTSTAIDTLALSCQEDEELYLSLSNGIETISATNVFGSNNDEDVTEGESFAARRNLSNLLDQPSLSANDNIMGQYFLRGDHLISGGSPFLINPIASRPAMLPQLQPSRGPTPPASQNDHENMTIVNDDDLLQEFSEEHHSGVSHEVFGVDSSVIDTPSSLDTAATHDSLDNGSIDAYYSYDVTDPMMMQSVSLGQELDDYDLKLCIK